MDGSVFLAGFRCFGAVAAATASPSHLTVAGIGGGSEPPSAGDGVAQSCGGGGGSLTTRREGRRASAGVCVLHVTDGSGWLAARGACAWIHCQDAQQTMAGAAPLRGTSNAKVQLLCPACDASPHMSMSVCDVKEGRAPNLM